MKDYKEECYWKDGTKSVYDHEFDDDAEAIQYASMSFRNHPSIIKSIMYCGSKTIHDLRK